MVLPVRDGPSRFVVVVVSVLDIDYSPDNGRELDGRSFRLIMNNLHNNRRL